MRLSLTNKRSTRPEILDHNIVHEYHYDLVLGTLEEIRRHVYARATRDTLPSWDFAASRQGWHYGGATDQGWPITGELRVQHERADAWLTSPSIAVRTEQAPLLVIDAAFQTSDAKAQVFWSTLEHSGFAEARSMTFPIQGDGEYREYRVRLADSPEYRGLLLQLQLHPSNEAGAKVHVRSVRLERESGPSAGAK
ncbi:MAG: hypothetical protein EOP84_33400 [Verrucomicrobiaceae bacterium]|nr:MAG: hypothetical protein EOP84_33400 [Verrucomicrobiaceae bacterium]